MLSKRKSSAAQSRMYVLDTNVLMHDPSSIIRFKEHDVYIPLQVLEELDNHKKGPSEISRNAREVCRRIDAILSGSTSDITKGISLKQESEGAATGRLFIQTTCRSTEEKADNKILDAVRSIVTKHSNRHVVLVSKDINMRVKGRVFGITVQDYHNDQVIEDTDLLYSGSRIIDPDLWAKQKVLKSWREADRHCYQVAGSIVAALSLNEFVCFPEERGGVHARVTTKSEGYAILRTMHDYSSEKNNIWGICARNSEQSYALNLLLDPEIDLVTLIGKAGSGKTLLTLAAGLQQTLGEKPLYSDIIITRATVPIGDDIGFLPGTEEEKMGPWMGALDDNLDVLHNNEDASTEWGRAATRDLLRSRIQVKSLNFMRGRTFLRKYLIIDEAQNLTAKQMKTLTTRAGPGTKVVCLGNLAQIDTPYLTEGSSGLAYIVDRFKGWEHGGHITLLSGERSRLASHANNVL